MNEPNYLNQESTDVFSVPPEDAVKKVPRIYSKQERLLLGFALLTGLAQQFIVWDGIFDYCLEWVYGLFYIPFFAVFGWLNREKLKRDRFLLVFTALSFAVSLTMLTSPGGLYFNLQFAVMFLLVTALVRYAQGGFHPKEVLEFLTSWVVGLFVSRFSALPHLFGSAASIGKGDKKKWRNILLGAGLAIGLLCVLVPLMMQADMVFGHYVSDLLRNINFEECVARTGLTCMLTGFTWSLLCNSRYGKSDRIINRKISVQFDGTVAGIVLVAVLAAYAIFCAVQFTFLFAQRGLPAGLTYSQYAVSGFWQLVQIAIINFALFGVYIEFAPKTKIFRGLLLGLLAATTVILTSAVLRLSMYIGAHGMLTWLRLISMWFLIYVAAVLVICMLRLFFQKLPAVAIALLLLVGWFALLGFVGPERFIEWFNQANWIHA